ncbi:hypothetical protein [Halopseudomonas salegens]|uniref:Uncharacterized protein n=1 Tax=Halopseudomonas salegens TaxID=1434072 RepID=A0A1H2E1T6_9GAMM|nr:hypothetical protein [Halopseudomonas salegens]SDT88668.1 hypothetical protein SAMN05216210_0191 [Halopseudomonas salegens]
MIIFPRFNHQAARVLTLLVCLVAIPQAQSVEGTSPPNIVFAETNYQLAWQSNPTPGYSKHEFLPQGQELPYYHNMLLVEQLTNGMTVPQVVQSQIELVTERKQSDPVAQHRIMNNEQTGEFLLDFLLSAADSEHGTIIEWNVYRYIPQQSADGSEGVLLLGYSARAYGDEEGRSFLIELQESRPQIIQALVSLSVPEHIGTTAER